MRLYNVEMLRLLHTERAACWFHLSSGVLSHEQCHTRCNLSQMSLSLCFVLCHFSHVFVCFSIKIIEN